MIVCYVSNNVIRFETVKYQYFTDVEPNWAPTLVGAQMLDIHKIVNRNIQLNQFNPHVIEGEE